MQCVEEGGELGTGLGEQLPLRVEGIAFRADLSRQLQLANRDLLQVDRAVHQIVETARRENELEPPDAAERVQLADVRLEGAQVLQVGELVVRELQLRLG